MKDVHPLMAQAAQRPTKGSPSRPDRTILTELSDQQNALLQNAAQRVAVAREAVVREERIYKELLAMAMPRGANGFDPQAGVFYYEEPIRPEGKIEEEPEEEDPAVPLEDTDEG